MKILITVTDAKIRRIVGNMLAVDGHEVITAHSCRQAVERYQRHNPDLALIDTGLEDEDGYTCTRTLKALHPDDPIPVLLLLTGPARTPPMERFLDSEAEDFLDAPFDHITLRARLRVMERMRQNSRQLRRYRAMTEHEIGLARHMFDVVTRRSPSLPEQVCHWNLAAGHFCGDLTLFDRGPDGHLYALLGDFTGHGLAAAIGALPTSDLFYEMVAAGCGVEQIATAINRKLKTMLPIGHFCAAALLSLDPAGRTIEIFNAGLPAILLVGDDHTIQRRLVSQNLPLGIVAPERFNPVLERVEGADLHSLLLYSDGLIEAEGPDGEPFGEARLEAALLQAGDPHNVFHRIRQSALAFLQGGEPHDDISLLSVRVPA